MLDHVHVHDLSLGLRLRLGAEKTVKRSALGLAFATLHSYMHMLLLLVSGATTH